MKVWAEGREWRKKRGKEEGGIRREESGRRNQEGGIRREESGGKNQEGGIRTRNQQ